MKYTLVCYIEKSASPCIQQLVEMGRGRKGISQIGGKAKKVIASRPSSKLFQKSKNPEPRVEIISPEMISIAESLAPQQLTSLNPN